MITHSKQTADRTWHVGQLVNVGFMRGLKVECRVPNTGDGMPDSYVLSHTSSIVKYYEFTPHNGLARIDYSDAMGMIARAFVAPVPDPLDVPAFVTVKTPVPVYYSGYGYPNCGEPGLQPGELARVINAKVPATCGNRPYFILAEFDRNGKTYQAAIWPDNSVTVKHPDNVWDAEAIALCT